MTTVNYWVCPKCQSPNAGGLMECLCGQKKVGILKISQAMPASLRQGSGLATGMGQHSGLVPKTPINDISGLTTDEAKLNKTERAFLNVLRGEGRNVGIQNVTLKLGDDCRYTPDFSVWGNGRLTCYEVKGFFRDDAKVKIKVASRQYHEWIDFVLVQRKDGQWIQTKVNP